MKLHVLMQSVFAKLTTLLNAKWTGEVTIRIALHRGGVRDARMFVATSEKWQVLTNNSKV